MSTDLALVDVVEYPSPHTIPTGELLFYTYVQNNSGGHMDFDMARGVSHFVIVQAMSAEDANRRAQFIGLYFGGDGDCSCCGDRWTEQWNDNTGTLSPQVYGVPAIDYRFEPFAAKYLPAGKPEIFVHGANGSLVGMWHH